MLKVIYTFFLGLLLAIFVGFGVATFYSGPEEPPYPAVLEQPLKPDGAYTEEQKAAEKAWEADQAAFTEKRETYMRNVSMIVLGFAIVLLIIGLALQTKIGLLADGLLLGGIFTLIYGISSSFSAGDPQYSFVVVSVGLLATLVLGYIKFMKQQPKQTNRTKKTRKK